MKKSGGSSIFALWDKAAKARKTDEMSTPNPTVAASSTCSPVRLESNLQLALLQELESTGATTTPTPNVQDDEDSVEDEPMQADLGALEHDPGKRIPISMYDVNDHDRVRRRYIGMRPCQPKNHNYIEIE